ncbi:MAG: lysophospholipid acyltransferase family protein, partial [Pseudomonadota bacterium]
NLTDEAFILASKHQSLYDTVVTYLFLPKHVTVMKRELLRAPVFGQYAYKVGVIAIDRAGAAKTLKALTKSTLHWISKGFGVLIYPEGTRRAPGAEPRYQVGVFALYKAAESVCVPMATNSGVFWPRAGREPRPGTLVYDVCPALPPGLDRADFMARLEGAIEPASDALLAAAREEGAYP